MEAPRFMSGAGSVLSLDLRPWVAEAEYGQRKLERPEATAREGGFLTACGTASRLARPGCLLASVWVCALLELVVQPRRQRTKHELYHLSYEVHDLESLDLHVRPMPGGAAR